MIYIRKESLNSQYEQEERLQQEKPDQCLLRHMNIVKTDLKTWEPTFTDSML